MVAHAAAKPLVYTMAGTASFFQMHGFPRWTAAPVALLELGGGIFLAAGVRVRTVAFALVPILLGALKVHFANGWMFTNAGGGWEYPAFLVVALLAQAALGAGRWTVPGIWAPRLKEGSSRR